MNPITGRITSFQPLPLSVLLAGVPESVSAQAEGQLPENGSEGEPALYELTLTLSTDDMMTRQTAGRTSASSQYLWTVDPEVPWQLGTSLAVSDWPEGWYEVTARLTCRKKEHEGWGPQIVSFPQACMKIFWGAGIDESLIDEAGLKRLREGLPDCEITLRRPMCGTDNNEARTSRGRAHKRYQGAQKGGAQKVPATKAGRTKGASHQSWIIWRALLPKLPAFGGWPHDSAFSPSPFSPSESRCPSHASST